MGKRNRLFEDDKKAIVFPWNKETHSLARFQELLPFTVTGFYDVKYNMNIGKDIASLLGTERPLGEIRNFDRIDWSADFDTVICGHCLEISKLIHRDFVQEIVEKCRRYRKRIYGFDAEFISAAHDFDAAECFVPGIGLQDRCTLPGGRLYNRLTPVVGVFGTSSRQGKFTVQMELRKRFLQQGYSVGQIASEPSGYLFRCDGVFPFGYHANVSTRAEDSLAVINKMIWDASGHNTKDIIIAGGQSGVVPYSHHNILQYNFKEHEFLCGVNPDVFVLCVNPYDPMEYGHRTIKYLYSLNGMPLVAVVLYPVTYEAANRIGYGYKKKRMTDSEIQHIREQLIGQTGVPTYLLGNDSEMDCMFDQVIRALSEE